MSELADLYQRVILEHHKKPRNAGRLSAPTHSADANNPLCGDRLTLTLQIVNGRIEQARCDVQGCAICRASGSLLTEAIVGQSLSEVSLLLGHFMAMLSGTGDPTEGGALGPLCALGHVRHFPNRSRCATLPWETLQRVLGAA